MMAHVRVEVASIVGQVLELHASAAAEKRITLLREAAPGLAATAHASRDLFPQFGLASRCTSQVLVPTGNEKITADPTFSSGQPNYRETLYGLVSFAGAGQPFDGNGQLLRVYAGGGPQLVRGDLPNGGFQNGSLWGHAIAAPIGTQPVVSGDQPPYRPDFACARNPAPNLNGTAAAPGAPSPEAYP
jgi:hypothetical protein